MRYWLWPNCIHTVRLGMQHDHFRTKMRYYRFIPPQGQRGEQGQIICLQIVQTGKAAIENVKTIDER